MEKRQRTRLLSAGVLVVVFASGALVGMAVQRSRAPLAPIAEAPPAGEATPRPETPGGTAGSRGRGAQRPRIYRQVLSPDQIVVADSIVQAIESRRDEIERDFRRDMDSIFTASARPQLYRQDREALTVQLRAEIRGLMNPEQLTLYDSLLAEDDARRRAEREAREQGRGGAGRQGRSGNPPN
jgi:hypothetical protein